MIFEIRLSSKNCVTPGTGTTQIESEHAASSAMSHSNLFSEKIPRNFKFGVPST